LSKPITILELGAWVEPHVLLGLSAEDWDKLRLSGIRHFFIEGFKHGRLDLRLVDPTHPQYLPGLLQEQVPDSACHAWVHTLRWSIARQCKTLRELEHLASPLDYSSKKYLACDLRTYAPLMLTHGREHHLSWDIEQHGGLFADVTRLHDGKELVDSPLRWALDSLAANPDIQTLHLDYCRYPNPNVSPLRRHVGYQQSAREHEVAQRIQNIAQLLEILVLRYGRERLSATPITFLNAEVGQDCRDFFRNTRFVVPQCYAETDQQVASFLKLCQDCEGQIMCGVVHGPSPNHPYGAYEQIKRIHSLAGDASGLIGLCFWKFRKELIHELAGISSSQQSLGRWLRLWLH
jgi:hypothetical protein